MLHKNNPNALYAPILSGIRQAPQTVQTENPQEIEKVSREAGPTTVESRDQTKPREPNSKSSLILLRHPHISINGSTESRETSAAKSSRLRARLRAENTTSQTTSRNTVGQVVLGAETLDAALGAGVERTDDTEVLGR